MYYVYVHTVPNGKVYIGQSKAPVKRWQNGEGYKNNVPFYEDILAYGWNSIRHEIVAQFRDEVDAIRLEAVLIALKKSENSAYGYNQTTIYEDAIKQYSSRVQIESVSLEKPIADDKFFEYFNLPVSACNEMIEQWVFNKKHREIAKSRLIDGLSYPELSKKYEMSVRQLKRVVYEVCDKLEKRL